jgi:hypothetical protein
MHIALSEPRFHVRAAMKRIKTNDKRTAITTVSSKMVTPEELLFSGELPRRRPVWLIEECILGWDRIAMPNCVIRFIKLLRYIN